MERSTSNTESAEGATPAVGSSKVQGSQTLVRGLDMLDKVVEGPVKLAELSQRMGLTRSTTHRLIALVSRVETRDNRRCRGRPATSSAGCNRWCIASCERSCYRCARRESIGGFGLHIGWAIEGAIGSNFKIDASYLSPNVNMASRLEAATKQFGTSILLSEDFVAMLSPRVRARVRQIDKVTVKGRWGSPLHH